MTKTLIEQWREGKLPNGDYYIKVRGNLSKKDFFTYDNCINGKWAYTLDGNVIDILAPVPSYDSLYNSECGIFPVLEIIVRNIENMQKRRTLTDLECGIKSQIVSLLYLWKGGK